MSYGSDKRLIINAREPRENEFVLHTGVNINDKWVELVMDYIDKHSNLSVEWIDREHFVEPGMMGFRLVKKPKIEPPIKEDEEIPF
tara:strand:+ start:495 stop:752 length:258 start_codon:yes stop_codon:yes gene_type:complete